MQPISPEVKNFIKHVGGNSVGAVRVWYNMNATDKTEAIKKVKKDYIDLISERLDQLTEKQKGELQEYLTSLETSNWSTKLGFESFLEFHNLYKERPEEIQENRGGPKIK